MVLLLLSQAFALECDVGDSLEQAETLMLQLETDAAQRTLEQVEERFSCGQNSSAEVARFWLVTAGIAMSSGDQPGIQRALTAARLADDTVWMESLGGDLKASWQVAEAPAEQGNIVLEDLPEGYQVRVDGKPVDVNPIPVPVGVHLVQVHAEGQGWGRMIRVQSDLDAAIVTGLPPLAAPEPEPEPEPERTMRTVGLHLAGGMRMQLGKRYQTAGPTESPAKIGPLVEAGLRLWFEPVVLRVGLAADIPLNSRMVYLDGAGESHTLIVAPSLWLSGGVQLGSIGVGVHVAGMLPARLPVHVYGSYGLTSRLAVEGRLGGSLVGERVVTGDQVASAVGFAGSFVLLATFTL